MNSTYVTRRLAYVDEVIDKVDAFGKSDPELASYLSSYLVVLISGIYEDCIERLFGERVEQLPDLEVRTYVRTTLSQSFRNPSYQRIKETLGKFSQSYAEEFAQRIDRRAMDALNSIITNKNKVAHGDLSNATLGEVSDSYSHSRSTLETIEEILEGRTV